MYFELLAEIIHIEMIPELHFDQTNSCVVPSVDKIVVFLIFSNKFMSSILNLITWKGKQVHKDWALQTFARKQFVCKE